MKWKRCLEIHKSFTRGLSRGFSRSCFFVLQKFEQVSLYVRRQDTWGFKEYVCQLATNSAMNARSCIRIRKRHNGVSILLFIFLSLHSQMRAFNDAQKETTRFTYHRLRHPRRSPNAQHRLGLSFIYYDIYICV